MSTTKLPSINHYYTGLFNKVSMGSGPGCKLASDGSCATTYDAYRYTGCSYNRYNDVSWTVAYIDRPVLLGGIGISSEGACCDKDAQCYIAANEGVCMDATCISDVCAGGPHDGEPCANNYDCYGSFAGIGTTCPENPEDDNPCCPLVWADIDRDVDIDQADFNQFQYCFSGSGVAAPTECHCWDRDGDTDVDADDYALFTPCWTGPNVSYVVGSLPLGCE